MRSSASTSGRRAGQLALAMVLLLATMVSPWSASAQHIERPNILFIMADDHARAAMSCYGSRTIETPNLDRLAAEGMRFDHMAVTLAICAPSRAVLLSGRYTHKNGLVRNNQHFNGAQPTFPKALQKAGYETAIIGKWHLATQPTGFDYYDVFPHQGHFVNCRFKRTGEPWKDGKEGGAVHEGYVTDLLTDKAVAWLRQRPASKPFCLMLHHKAPHGPHVPAPRHADLLEDIALPEPDNLLDDYSGRIFETLAESIPSRLLYIKDSTYRERTKRAREMGRTEGTRFMYQEYMKGYLRLVASLDENVGRLLDHLEASELARDTLVIYTSDNGYFNGEHGFHGKGMILEESMLVPLFVRWPGVVPPGSRNDALVSMLDIGPTLIDVARGETPAGFQGRSFQTLLRGGNTTWRHAVYYHYYGNKSLPEQFGIRTKTHKLIHYPEADRAHRWELFDLRSDPGEMRTLHSNPDSRDLADDLKEQLRGLIDEYEDTTATITE